MMLLKKIYIMLRSKILKIKYLALITVTAVLTTVENKIPNVSDLVRRKLWCKIKTSKFSK